MNQTEDAKPPRPFGPARIGLLALVVAIAAFAVDLPWLHSKAFEFIDIKVEAVDAYRIDNDFIQGFRIVNVGRKTADGIAIRFDNLPVWQRGPTLDSLDGCKVTSAGPSEVVVECTRLSPGRERGKGLLMLFAFASNQKLDKNQVEVGYSGANSSLPGPRLLWQLFSSILLFAGVVASVVAIIAVLISVAVPVLRLIHSVTGKIEDSFQKRS